MHSVNSSVSSVDRQDQPSRWGSIFSGMVSAAKKTARVVYHALPGTGPAKPPGLPKKVIEQIKKAQEKAEKQSAAHEERRVASIEAAEKGKGIEQTRESPKQKRKRLAKESAHPLKSKTVEQPVKVEVAPSTEPRSNLRSYLTTAAAVAGVVTAAYLAAPYVMAVAGLTAATTTPTVFVGTTSTALVAYTAPAVATMGSALATTAVNTSLVPLGMQAAGSLLAAGAAITAQRGNVNINVNNLDLFAREIGVPREDLFDAAAQFQRGGIDPTIRRTILELGENPSGGILPPQIEADTSLAMQPANTPSSTMQSSAARFLQWATSPAIRALGTPIQILEHLASRIFQFQPVADVNAHGTSALSHLPAPNTVLAISPPPIPVSTDTAPIPTATVNAGIIDTPPLGSVPQPGALLRLPAPAIVQQNVLPTQLVLPEHQIPADARVTVPVGGPNRPEIHHLNAEQPHTDRVSVAPLMQSPTIHSPVQVDRPPESLNVSAPLLEESCPEFSPSADAPKPIIVADKASPEFISPSTQDQLCLQDDVKPPFGTSLNQTAAELGLPVEDPVLPQFSDLMDQPLLTGHLPKPDNITQCGFGDKPPENAETPPREPSQTPTPMPTVEPVRIPEDAGIGLGTVAAGIGTAMLGKLLFGASQPSSTVQKAEVVGANGWSYTIAINLPDGKKEYSKDEIEMISKALVTGVLDKLSEAGSIEAGVPLAIELPETGGFKATTLKPEGKKPAKSGKPVKAPKVYEYKPDQISPEQQTYLAPLRLVLAIPANPMLYETQRQASFLQLQTYFNPKPAASSAPVLSPATRPVRYSSRPVGLRNASTGSRGTHTASNLCALNAAFQSLCAVPEYRAAMRVSTCDPLRKAVENYKRIQAAQFDELVDLTALLNTFTSSGSIPSLRNKRQHDSSEYENGLVAMLEQQTGNPILGMRVKAFKRFTYLNGDKHGTTKDTAAAMTTRFTTEKPISPNFDLVMPQSDLRLSSMIDAELFAHIIDEERTIPKTRHKKARTVLTGLRLKGEMMFERPPEVLSFDVKRGMGNIYVSGNTDLYGNLDPRKIQVDETYKLKIKSPDKADTEATYDLTSFRVYDGSGSSGHHYSYQKQVVALADGITQVKYIMTNDGAVRDDLTREQFLAAAQAGVSFRFRLKR